jgi:hypothetical protein
MTSDDALRSADRPRAFSGVGVAMTFMCPACAKVKLTPGRRLKRYRGLRQYLCAACVPKVSK